MKPLIVLLSICALGYAADHWEELTTKSEPLAAPSDLIIYVTRSSGDCIRLEEELNKQGIRHERRDMGKEANARELIDKYSRIGKIRDKFVLPVADIDGVLVEKASVGEITRRLSR